MPGAEAGPVAIDLLHGGVEGAIACYLIDADGPTVIDPGPTTTVERLVEELDSRGVGRGELDSVVLTHIHLDHAGATGRLLELFPKARAKLHPAAAPHLADPERLVASTRRTFGPLHDELWGEVVPAPADRIDVVEPGWRLGRLRAVATPGHISHHLAYLDGDGTLFSGDSMGIVLEGGPTHPPTPAPAIDLPAWRRTLETIRGLGAERFAATHFGTHSGVEARAGELAERLCKLEDRVRQEMDDPAAAERYRAEVLAEQTAGRPPAVRRRIERYFTTFPAHTDWDGMVFHLRRNPR